MMLLHAIRKRACGGRFSFRMEGGTPAKPSVAGMGSVAPRSRMRGSSTLRSLAGLAAIAFALAGCRTPSTEPSTNYAPLVARFYLEVKPEESGVAIKLPQSGVTITVAPKPVVVEYDIANAEVAQVELGRCLLVQLNGPAARDLYRLSVAMLGRRLVLSLNDQFVGARRIDQAIEDGAILTFIEISDAELPSLVARLKRTSADLAETARKARQ